MKRLRAFTLAEVLITLGIIGVVAAITMPTIVSKYKKNVYYNKFLKSVNIVENYAKTCCVLDGYEDISDCDLNVYFGTGQENFNEFKRIVNICNSKINLLNKDQLINDTNIIPVKYLNGELDDSYYLSSHVLVFPDNTSVFFPDIWGRDYSVDTNGPYIGPNIVGRDIFLFRIESAGLFSQSGIFWPGNKNADWWGLHDDCNINGEGLMCAGKLLNERKMDY